MQYVGQRDIKVHIYAFQKGNNKGLTLSRFEKELNPGVGKGSLAPTRDKCGQEFAPRESKGDFQVSKRVICDTNRQGVVQGDGGIKNRYHQQKMMHIKLFMYIVLMSCLCYK